MILIINYNRFIDPEDIFDDAILFKELLNNL